MLVYMSEEWLRLGTSSKGELLLYHFVDTHCHIDLYDDPKKIIEQACQQGIEVIAVTNAPSVYAYTRGLCRGYANLKPAIGLHPLLVTERFRELRGCKSDFVQSAFVGEIGLDYSNATRSQKYDQRVALDLILSWCSNGTQKVLSLHSKRAVGDVLAALSPNVPKDVKIILHWFTGTTKELSKAVGMGAFFSVNEQMLRTKSGRTMAMSIPQGNLLTETDGPFVERNNKPISPVDVPRLTREIAGIWGVSIEEAAYRIHGNFQQCNVVQ